MKIFSKFPTVNILNLNFCFVICIAKNFIKTALRQFSQYLDFFAPSDSRFSNSCISDKYCPIITIHQWKAYLFQMMYKSRKIYTYDWFCGPGSHLIFILSFNALWGGR